MQLIIQYGQATADRTSKHISDVIAKLKKFPEIGISMREQYGLECDYYVLFVAHNYFIYRITDDMVNYNQNHRFSRWFVHVSNS